MVKTRLAAAIGDEAACRVSEVLLDHTMAVVRSTGLASILSLAAPVVGGWSPGRGMRLEIQGRGDLGDRLRDCFTGRFRERSTRAIVIGSDCPGLTGRHLVDAARALETCPVVVGPALDGGYWLIGQQHPGHDLFSGIPWSSPSTLEQTRQRLQHLRLRWSELPTLRDIDTLADLNATLSTSGGSRGGPEDRAVAALARRLERAGGLGATARELSR